MKSKESILMEIKNTHLLIYIAKGDKKKITQISKLYEKLKRLQKELESIENKDDF